jgi:hypothetical protein
MLVASPLPPTLSEALSCKVKRQMRLPRRMRLRNLKPTVPNVNGAGRYKPMPRKLIDPIAIGALVSQACQSFELLERLHEGSVVLSPGVLIPSGSNRRVSPQTRSPLSPFSLPAPARQPAQDLMFSEQDLSRQRFFDPSSEEAHHDIRMLGRDSV